MLSNSIQRTLHVPNNNNIQKEMQKKKRLIKIQNYLNHNILEHNISFKLVEQH